MSPVTTATSLNHSLRPNSPTPNQRAIETKAILLQLDMDRKSSQQMMECKPPSEIDGRLKKKMNGRKSRRSPGCFRLDSSRTLWLWISLVCLLLIGLSPHYCSGLICKICRHTGQSMIPPHAPRSRFIFNAPSPSCIEDEITCADRETMCMSAYGNPRAGEHWVQKGCTSSTGFISSESGGRGRGGQGCTEQVMDLSQAQTLPVKNPDRPLPLHICVCNSEDNCNAGPVIRSSGRSLHQPIASNSAMSTFASIYTSAGDPLQSFHQIHSRKSTRHPSIWKVPIHDFLFRCNHPTLIITVTYIIYYSLSSSLIPILSSN